MKNTTKAVTAIMLSALAGSAAAEVITVGPSLTDFDYLTITAAIAGSSSGDEIVIAPGIYPENLTISGKDLTLRNAGGGTVTIFGQGLARCLILTGGTNLEVVLKDLIFTGGLDDVGAGIAVGQAFTAIIENCIIEGNDATNEGGGMYISGVASLTNVIIRGNTAGVRGGGIVSTTSLGSTTTLVDCVFEDNTAANGGAYAYAKPGELATIVGCTFRNNTATSRGGAIAVYGTAAVGTLRVDDSLFDSNRAEDAGGAIWVSDQDVFRAVNSVFMGNSAANAGGVVRNEQIFDATNCTFYDNDVDAAGINDSFEALRADADTNLLNCIVVNDSAGSKSGPGDLVATYSLIPDVSNTEPDGQGNFAGDPMFIDAPMGDLRPSAGSPAIDAGNSLGALGSVSIVLLPTDIAGQNRNLDDPDSTNIGVPAWALNIDMGAYEYQPNPQPDCLADLNGDGVLDFFDVSQYLNLFSAGCP
jgi:predicted outer membrane repeat protein